MTSTNDRSKNTQRQAFFTRAQDRDFVARLKGEPGELDDQTIPLADIPEHLPRRLFAIAELPSARKPPWVHWGLAVAASLVLLGVVFQFQPATPSDKDVEHARRELALAFYYLQNANQQTREQVQQALSREFEEASVRPVFEILDSSKPLIEDQL